MKVKTSFTISTKTLKAVDRLVGRTGNRSAFVEEALIAYVKARTAELRDAHDRATYAKHADEINRELEDALSYAAEPAGDD
jgi:metal-responsive CopG/Arc/MetJ family transcriptional regulator